MSLVFILRLQEATRDGDAQTQQRAKRFLKRPEEELYDIQSDPYCLDNLALHPELFQTKARLSAAVDDWMTEQGDLGRQTELDAYSRQAEWRRRQRMQQLKDAESDQPAEKAPSSR